MKPIKNFKHKLLSWLIVGTGALSLLPLAHLGLITPHMKTALLAGLADTGIAVIIFMEGIRIGMLDDKKHS